MAVTIKSEREIGLMRESCRILAEVHARLSEAIKPGISTWEINELGDGLIRSYGCVPNFLNYNGYPASICVSVNDEVVHGIPSKKRILKEGDIVSLDAGLIYKGYHSDEARTYGVGKISPQAKRLIDVTRQSFFEGIRYARAGHYLHEISNAIDAYCTRFGYGVVRDLVGHGIGTHLHEEPQIPNFRQWRKGIRLRAGMTLAIEPMVNMGGYKVAWLEDDWTVVTRDGSLSAHYENTILITEGEPEILTLLPQEITGKAGVALTGMFAVSLAGHDKGRMYFIIKEEGDFAYLTDGRIRGVGNPKKKRKKHLQIIKTEDEVLSQKLKDGKTIYNEEIKFAIKVLNQNQN